MGSQEFCRETERKSWNAATNGISLISYMTNLSICLLVLNIIYSHCDAHEGGVWGLK